MFVNECVYDFCIPALEGGQCPISTRNNFGSRPRLRMRMIFSQNGPFSQVSTHAPSCSGPPEYILGCLYFYNTFAAIGAAPTDQDEMHSGIFSCSNST